MQALLAGKFSVIYDLARYAVPEWPVFRGALLCSDDIPPIFIRYLAADGAATGTPRHPRPDLIDIAFAELDAHNCSPSRFAKARFPTHQNEGALEPAIVAVLYFVCLVRHHPYVTLIFLPCREWQKALTGKTFDTIRVLAVASFRRPYHPMNKTERALVYGVPVGLLIAEGIALLTGLTPPPHQLLGAVRHFPLLTLAAVAIAFLTVRREEVMSLLVVGSAIETVRLLVLAAIDTPLTDALSTTGAGLWYASLLLSI